MKTWRPAGPKIFFWKSSTVQVSNYSLLPDCNPTQWLVKEKAVNAPIKLEKIVIVMTALIGHVIGKYVSRVSNWTVRVFVKIWSRRDKYSNSRDQRWWQSCHLGMQCPVGVGVGGRMPPCHWGGLGPSPENFRIFKAPGCILGHFWPIWLSVLARLKKAFAA